MIRAIGAALLLTGTATAAGACQPMPGEVLDDLGSPQAAVAVAEVTGLAIAPHGADGSCLVLGYRRGEMLRGALPATFEAEICVEGERLRLEDFAAAAEDFGFAAGATVLVGVMRQEAASPGWRVAIPDCWGPFHLRLDLMEATERRAFMADIRQGLSTPPP